MVNNPTDFTATGVTGAMPGADISYRIIAKNTYNTAVVKFFISDTVPTNTTFKSVSIVGVTAAKTIYSVNGGTSWQTAAPTAADTNIAVAVDDNDDLIPDALASVSELSATFVVTVK